MVELWDVVDNQSYSGSYSVILRKDQRPEIDGQSVLSFGLSETAATLLLHLLDERLCKHSEPTWTKPEDEMPDADCEVLVIDEDGSNWLASYDDEQAQWIDSTDEGVICRVTHWQHLPEPPTA